MNRDAWDKLITTFAPQVTLSYTGGSSGYNDQYLPSSIDWFLERCSLVDKPKGVDVEAPERSTIANTRSKTARLNPNDKDVNKGDYSQIPEGTWPMYVHVLKSEYPPTETETDHIDLQYWFFYPYSGGIGGLFKPWGELHGAHEGDWEFISVRVRNWRNNTNLTASNIVGVFYAAHRSADGKWVMRQGSKPSSGVYALVDGTHPRVFSAWHSHASYECPGLQLRTLPLPFWAKVLRVVLLLAGVFIIAILFLSLWPLAYVALVVFVYGLFFEKIVGNDYCAEGISWGPLDSVAKYCIEIMKVDSDVYQPGDERLEGSAWIEYDGLWGSNIKAPESPPNQSALKWNGEATNGYEESPQLLGSYSSWSNTTGVLGIALGLLNVNARTHAARPTLVLLAGRSSFDKGSDRFKIWEVTQGEENNLKYLTNGGTSWDKNTSCTRVAMGEIAESLAFAVAMEPAGSIPFEINHLVENKVTTLVNINLSSDKQWHDATCTDLVFGSWQNTSGEKTKVIATARNGDSGPFVHLYQSVDKTLSPSTQVASIGSDWQGQICTRLCFIDSEVLTSSSPLFGVAKSRSSKSRFGIYHAKGPGELPLLFEGGTHWDPKLDCTAIAFGILGGKLAMAVGTNATAGMRFQIYQLEITVDDFSPKLTAEPLVKDGGSAWDSSLGVSGIAFCMLNGIGVVALSTVNSKNLKANKIFTYQWIENALVSVGTTGVHWGADRNATCIAAYERSDGLPLLAFGRNTGNNDRVDLTSWSY